MSDNFSKPLPDHEPGFMTSKQRTKFLDAYATEGTITAACEASGVSYYQYRKELDAYKTFEDDCEVAKQQFADRLEGELFRRAVHGVKKGIYYQGEVVGYEMVKSDKLLEVAVKAAKREKYSQKVDHTLDIPQDLPERILAGRNRAKLLEQHEVERVPIPPREIPAPVEVEEDEPWDEPEDDQESLDDIFGD